MYKLINKKTGKQVGQVTYNSYDKAVVAALDEEFVAVVVYGERFDHKTASIGSTQVVQC